MSLSDAALPASVPAFRPDEHERFRFTGWSADAPAGTVELHYALDDRWSFTEQLQFGAPLPTDGPRAAGFRRVVRLLHLVAGVSYYKAAAPDVLSVETGPLTDAERSFVRSCYDDGLREFAVRNGLPVPRHIVIDEPPALTSPQGPNGALRPGPPPPGLAVPVGGGKDSIVVVEALRELRPTLVTVHGHPAARRTAEVAGLPLVVLDRRIDPLLLQLNRSGARNGHVPVTAITALLVVAAGYVHGWDTVAMALESSADEPTRMLGVGVNHQWSKSTEAERALAALLRDSVHPALGYGSVLRDLDELAIAACFATMPRYHHAFRSCNRSFSLADPLDGWCCACPKCRFVFLALATAMAPADLVAIFGADLLDDPAQLEGFRDLLEEGRKPYECVGTRAESLVALGRLRRDPRWRDRAVVRALAPEAPEDGSGSGDRPNVPALLGTIRRRSSELAGR